MSLIARPTGHLAAAALLVLAIALALPRPAWGANGLTGYYFANTGLSGAYNVTRVDANINFDWVMGSPHASIPFDGFSVRWVGYLVPPASGTYTLYITSDDGSRLYLNGAKVADQWSDHGLEDAMATGLSLAAGQAYPVTVEYYDAIDEATMFFDWASGSITRQRVPTSALLTDPGTLPVARGTGLQATYYNSLTPGTNPVLSRVDPQINFGWGVGSPGGSVPSDNFSVRWTGYLVPTETLTYTFSITSDDGARMWLAGQLIIDNWVDGTSDVAASPVLLQAGHAYAIRVEYYDHGGAAAVYLSWSTPEYGKFLVPVTVLYVSTATPTSTPTSTATPSGTETATRPVCSVLIDEDGSVRSKRYCVRAG